MFKRGRFLKLVLLMVIFVIAFGTVNVFAGSTAVKRSILSQVEPKGMTYVYRGQNLKLRALADYSATVTAKVNGVTVNLKRTTDKYASYYWFEGSYTIPFIEEDEDLDVIEFTAKLGSITEKKTTAGLKGIVLPANEVLEENVTTPTVGGSGQQVMVNKKYIDVFKTEDKGEDYAAPYYYNLPEGTIDYIKSTSGSTYELLSGRKVLQSDVKVIGNGTLGDNIISNLKITSDGEMTTLNVEGIWNVPFNVEALPFTYSTGNWVTSYDVSKVLVTFDYTSKMNLSNVKLPSDAAFDDVDWYVTEKDGIKQGVLELSLSEKGKYYGCYAEYTSDGMLKLRFYNPIKRISDARIVIDPGHGKNAGNNDSGTIGIDGSYESALNLEKAKALRDELERRGATVYMLDSDTSDLKDLYKRCSEAYNWEPHIYISVHHNSGNASARGVETYYNTPFSMPLAKSINDAVFNAYLQMKYSSGAKNRGYKFSEFAVTRQKQYASVLLEYGFMSNTQEMEILKDADNVSLFARYTADGIATYFAGY